MATGPQDFQIILDTPKETFSPGDIVAGRVHVQLRKKKIIKGLKIRFKGRAEVHWSESTGTGNREKIWHRNAEDYFRQEFDLLDGVDACESVEIGSGCHVFPFTFTLPHDIPSSFESFGGKVTYTIKASMEDDHKTEISLKVQAPYDLSIIPAAQLAIEDEETKAVCCFPCGRGSLSVIISLPFSGFAIGKPILTTVTINNKTTVRVLKIKLRLIQKIKLYANGRSKRDVRIIQKMGTTGPFGRADERTLGMQVSATPPSGFPHCKIMDVQYSLAVKVVFLGCHRSIEREYPILIGTRATFNSCSMRNAHAIPHRTSSQFREPEKWTTEKPPPSYDTCVKADS